MGIQCENEDWLLGTRREGAWGQAASITAKWGEGEICHLSSKQQRWKSHLGRPPWKTRLLAEYWPSPSNPANELINWFFFFFPSSLPSCRLPSLLPRLLPSLLSTSLKPTFESNTNHISKADMNPPPISVSNPTPNKTFPPIPCLISICCAEWNCVWPPWLYLT